MRAFMVLIFGAAVMYRLSDKHTRQRISPSVHSDPLEDHSMQTNSVKAWVVEANDTAVVVFASTERSAACIASEELEVSMERLKAKRFPAMDRYAPGPVPAYDLVTLFHWVLRCATCGEAIPHTKKALKAMTAEEHLVFCSKDCKTRHQHVCIELDRELSNARQTIRELCPDPKFMRWWLEGDDGTLVYQFLPPGSLHVVTWHANKPGQIFCVASDMDLIEEFRTKSRRLH